MPHAMTALRERLAVVSDLRDAAGVLGWDQRTMMAPRGVGARAEQLGTLARVTHELFTSEETGALLEQAERAAASLDPDSDDACLVRITRRDYEKARRVPAELRADISRTSSLATPIWSEARRRSDWDMFLPQLETAIDLRRRYVDCFEPADEDYDVLLDDYEPGMTTAEVRAVFAEMKAGLVPLISEIAARSGAVDDSFLRGAYPIERQRTLERRILDAFGFTPESWRLDETVHPFQSMSRTCSARLAKAIRSPSIS
ncbi:MAG TPA: hypothetical protein VF363_03155 [Candidatus Eisenbacteria bacterium]